MRRQLVLTALIAAYCLPVLAQQVVLYEGRDFRGRSVTITQPAPNLGYHGFEDRASSMYVMSGTWEICSEPYFRGQCRTYGPGEYPALGGKSDRISSARAIGPGGHGGPAVAGREWIDSGTAEVSVFDRRDFQGPLRTLRESTPNFEPLGFNDAIASIIVRRGTWEFCTDAQFQGECRTYGPGQYASLPGGHDDRYSSARVVASGGPGGAGAIGAEWVDSGAAEVHVFGRRDFQGTPRALRSAAPNFAQFGFNDAIASIIVRSGTWEFCTDAGFQGECRIYGPGQYASLPSGDSDRYSSARPVEERWAGGLPDRGRGNQGPARIRLFEYGQFAGRSIWLGANTPDFERIGFNDRAESVIVEGGSWTLCSDANQRGECRVFRPGQYPVLPPELRSRISSAYVR